MLSFTTVSPLRYRRILIFLKYNVFGHKHSRLAPCRLRYSLFIPFSPSLHRPQGALRARSILSEVELEQVRDEGEDCESDRFAVGISYDFSVAFVMQTNIEASPAGEAVALATDEVFPR